jgi:uncharacterized SAM-binding protein YcdF (DUF218 family)
MILGVLLLTVVVATVLVILRFKRSGRVLFIIAAVLFLLVGSGIPANLMLNRLQDGLPVRTEDWGTANAIVLLGAGSEMTDQGPEMAAFSYGRLTKAFELYRFCKSRSEDCRIISSGGDPRGFGKSEAELYAEALERMGAARADLVVEGRSNNTWQNAQFTAEILTGQQPDRVVLVTSGLHVRRSLLYFSHFGVRSTGVRADYAHANVSLLPNAYNILLTDLAIHEYLGVLRYHVYNLLGWNVQAVRPGAL